MLGTGRTDALSKKASKGGLAFLAYLKTYLNIQGFWLSWSRAGTLEAAWRLKVPVESIARTTNHLESFNGRIKGKWFAPYIHSGRLPRIDHWILTMITKVMPRFFQERTERRQQHDYYLAMRYTAPVRSPRSNSDGDDQPVDEASSSVKPASEASVCEITAEIEVELLDQLQDDDDSGEAEDEEAFEDDVEAMEGYGMELQIEMASEVAVDESGSDVTANFDCDNALDSSSILNNLPGNTSVLFPFTSMQPDVEDSSLKSLDLDGLGLLHLSPFPCQQQLEIQDKPMVDSSGLTTGDPTHSNAETTSY